MIDRAIGIVLIVTAIAVVLREWVGGEAPLLVASAGLVAFLVLAAPRAHWSRQSFVAVGVALVVAVIALRPDWQDVLMRGLGQGAFIAAFFIALASLRNPASASPAIERCGQYLASQPPGKRYLSLTMGGHLFALILSYGSISLLGGLTESIASREANAEIREIRNRRMLLAIQRGFVASLAWSPLAFAMAISTSVVPGSTWSGAAPIAILNAILITFVGWSLDTIFKPRLTQPAPARRPLGSWRDLRPLLMLLLLLFAGVTVLEVMSGLRIIAVVMLLVPVIAVAWVVIQTHGDAAATGARLRQVVFRDVPSYQSELVLLVMAGIIGTVGGALLEPLFAGQSLGLSALPAWAILVLLVWIIPLLGQLGMNPILSVSLLAPLLPAPAAMGVSPNAVVVALTAGWALAGATSPFTATTMLVGRLGHTSAWRVGVVWNRSFTLVTGAALSVSVALAGFL
ncbi:hypothetical protein [Aurantimonas sp. HBX-1]|uniref:hypothetical protein n=1 Tax=Aurantimonas sp. HBX-1 TaxID=2906072 RepID=UPI001F3EAA1C|nr:hypothetical protein [Aurantimonas sp. HBX-1]UIJ70979.1 hypothetical protein LXB15_14765 [Aurantimonas sp. HBX-1]